jgi:dihydropteroate synthase
LSTKIKKLTQLGVVDIIVDPGFGFGKTLEQNYQLLARLQELEILGHPILAGVSRKSMIYKLLDTHPDQALNGTTAAHVLALECGARILRVHDVWAARQAITIWKSFQQGRFKPNN